MDKYVVLNAIEHRMRWIYQEVYLGKPKWDNTFKISYKEEVNKLYEAYMEIRGKKEYDFYDIGFINVEEMYNAMMVDKE